MRIVIMGCGRVGSTLAHSLALRGHTIVVVDQDSEAFRRLGADWNQPVVTGIGFDREVLIKAGIEQADGFAAVSSGDNSNIISARLAKETFNVPRVVARIYDPKRAEVYERLGIATVATVRWTADRMVRQLVPEGQLELWRDPTGSIGLIELTVHEGWISRPIRDLGTACGGRVAYVVRFGVATLPHGSSAIQESDKVYMLVNDQLAHQAAAVAAAPPEHG